MKTVNGQKQPISWPQPSMEWPAGVGMRRDENVEVRNALKEGLMMMLMGKKNQLTMAIENLASKVDPSPATHAILRRWKAGDEGGRVHQALLVTIQCVKAIYSGTTTASGTFWRPGGI